jgi:hypothetical protein
MKESTTSKSSGGISFCSALFLLFLTLKLCGVISWSWWWVSAPLWVGVAFLGVSLLVLGFLFVGAYIYHAIWIKGEK